jgi:prolyl-tRNA synthetase
MRRSKQFSKTLKQAPADEVARNAQLLVRGGFVHKEMAGVYAYLPLGLRVIEKIKQIVREEMNRTGSEELLMSVLQPSDIWEQTNRWDDKVVDNWFKTKLLNGTELGVGLTHEEPVVDAAKSYIGSYKDLPRSVYQIGNKFRNEKRAKSGILRGREFIMKDAYTFARNQLQHEELYEQVAEAYHRVYERLGIGADTVRVKADGGIFTKRYSDEFQTKSPIGEDTIFHIPDSDIYYNQEVAPSKAPSIEQPTEQLPLDERSTPGVKTVEQLAKELDVPVTRTVKTLIYNVDGRTVAVAVRGDYAVNDIKLRRALDATSLELADEATIKQATGAGVGFAGLLGLPADVQVVADDSIEHLVNFEMGANKTDFHSINVNWGRDLPKPEKFYDVKEAKEGDLDPESSNVYEVFRGVEVGNIFPLESKFSDALDLYYTDEKGERQSIVMGCYGIGVSRLMGVIAEHMADERGLVWPRAIAPYSVYIVAIGDEGSNRADNLYAELTDAGIDTIYDDRDARPGEKFADAELLGIPWRVTASDRLGDSYELTDRTTGETSILTHDALLAKLK